MVKISELKLPSVRKTIPFFDKDGNENTIHIYNLTSETKKKIIEIMQENTTEEGTLTINPLDMLRDIFPMMTDLEIDMDFIDDIIENPSKEMVLINSEVLSMINEINMEHVMNQNLEYERLLILSEQMRGMNMVAFIKNRMERFDVKNDFDPLNADAMQRRNEMELKEAKESYQKVMEIYEEAAKSNKTEADTDA